MADKRIEEEDAPYGQRGGEREHKARRALALEIETIATRVKSGESLHRIAVALEDVGKQAQKIGK